MLSHTLALRLATLFITRSSSSAVKPHEGAYNARSHNGNFTILISVGMLHSNAGNCTTVTMVERYRLL